MNVSVIILARNEAGVIGACLDSVAGLNPTEVLVIDDDSVDATAKIARDRGAQVIRHRKKDFAAARNFAKTQAKSDWIFYVDADEQVTPELITQLEQLVSYEPEVAAATVGRQNYYLGERWPKEERVTRFFKKTGLIGWEGKIHESPRVLGRVCDLSGLLIHHTHRSLEEMVANTIVWSKIEAELRFMSGHPPVSWWRIPRVMLPVFWDYYFRQGGWQTGTVGLIESIYQAFSIFITYARLWEMSRKAGQQLK